MPQMNGLELVGAIRAHHPLVPIVLMTANGSEEIAVQALQRGAASYLPKSRLADELQDTVENVLALARGQRDQGRLQECVAARAWQFVIDNDKSLIAPLVDQVRRELTRAKICDENSRTRQSIALHEALMNAIDHGNLELSSDMREADDPGYQRLGEERRLTAPYSNRRVYVRVKVNRDSATYIIRDEGPGFDPSKLPDPTDPSNLERVYGRGLLLVRTFMDEVSHNSSGNEITMVKRRET
jgi:anti-sigma regulatory factor (Ser/Thr protein kinase)